MYDIYYGNPYGRVWHFKLGSISTIRRNQLMLQDNKQGLDIVKEWLGIKLQNQIDLLKILLENRRDEERKALIHEAINFLSDNTVAPLDYKFAVYKEHTFKTYKIQLVMYSLMIEEMYELPLKQGLKK